MQAAVSNAADPSGIVGKRELAQHLKWSRPTLDRRLLQDPRFPVRARGTRAGGWAFSLADVDAHLAGTPFEVEAPAGELDLPAPVRADDGRAQHSGEATARQRRDQADAELKEDRLRRQRGELVEAETMRATVATMLAGVAAKLQTLPDVLIRRLGLPDTAGPTIREEIDQLRRAMVDDLRAVLSE